MVNKIFLLLFLLSVNQFSFSGNPNAQKNLNKNEKKTDLQDNEDKQNNVEKVVNQPQEPEIELLDEIVSEVYYCQNPDSLDSNIITQAEVDRRGFDGNVYTVTDLENQNLLGQYGKLLKAKQPSNDDINRMLKKNGMTENDIINIANRWLFLDKEHFIDSLKNMSMESEIFNYEIASQLVASRDEIQEYYQTNCQEYTQEAKYFVETAFVECRTNTSEDDIQQQEKKLNAEKNKIKTELQKYIKGEIPKPNYVDWDLPVEITQSEISKDNSFLSSLPIGSIYMLESPTGFVLYRMKNKIPQKMIPLESVEEDIAMVLKKDKYPLLAEKVRNKLRDHAIIVHPNNL